jgi:putative addiction module killer protein
MKILTTKFFEKWFAAIRDRKLKIIITERLNRISEGILGDVNFIAEGVWEIRIHFGAGYRIYYTRQGREIILLLCAGDKGTQKRDIERAREMANDK